MKQVVYLIVTPNGVDRMTKRMPDQQRGELPIKLTVNLPHGLFSPPVISQEITVADPRDGLDIERDVELRQLFITPDEADMLRRRRMSRMREILEAAGYEIKGPEDEGDGEVPNA